MIVIILAAGHGKRLLPHTVDRPKCLIDLGGTSVLEHQLHNCRRAGIKHVAVVTGFMSELVDDRLAAMRRSFGEAMTVESIFNPFYAVSNNLISVWVARHRMNQDFILLNGDNVFRWQILAGLVENQSAPILVTTSHKDKYDEDDMKIIEKHGRIVLMNKQIPVAAANGESIGMMKFTGEGRQILQDMLETMARGETATEDWYVQAIERIAKQGGPVGMHSVTDQDWAEIDFPDDLVYVRQNLRRFESA